jgi:hypothetical protein
MQTSSRLGLAARLQAGFDEFNRDHRVRAAKLAGTEFCGLHERAYSRLKPSGAAYPACKPGKSWAKVFAGTRPAQTKKAPFPGLFE